MRLTQIFKDVKKQWPQNILVDDCILWENGKGLTCEWMWNNYCAIDKDCVHGDWGRLMNWGIYCGLHKYIKTISAPYPKKIYIDCLDMKRAIEAINESINSPDSDYSEERDKYVNDLHTLLESKS